MSQQIQSLRQIFMRWKIKSHIRGIERRIARLENRFGV